MCIIKIITMRMRSDLNKKRNKFSVAVIGCGNIGTSEGHYHKRVQPGTHAGAFSGNAATELVAFVDPDEARLKEAGKRFPGVALFSDIDTMMREVRPAIVAIATPTALHAEHVTLVAKYQPRLILCEKPLAYDVRAARHIVEYCATQNVPLFVNHQRRFDLLLRAWSDKVRAGLLGDLYQGDAYYYNGLFNNGSHLVDLLCAFLGDVIEVRGFLNTRTSNVGTPQDPNVDGILRFKNGALVALHSLSKNYGFFGARIFGDKGMLDISHLGFQIQHAKKIPNRSYKGFFELADASTIVGEPRSMIASTVSYLVSFLGGKIKNPIGTGRDALKVLAVLEALKESANADGKIILLS